jgi:hypothetical protein
MPSEGTPTPPPVTRRPPERGRLRAAVRRHPWRTLALCGCVLVVAGLAALFNPALQKRWLLPRIAPHVERLHVDFLQVTPWSLDLRGVDVQWQGMQVSIGEAGIVFNPFGLLTDTVVVHELAVRAGTVDLTRYRAGPPSTTPFPGLLSVLDAGYGVVLNDVDATLNAILPDGQEVRIRLSGSGIRPHVSGALDYTLALRRVDGEIEARGQLTVEQLSRGRFRRVHAAADVELALASLPHAERAAVTLELTPAPGTGRARYLARRDRGHRPPPPEAVAVTLTSVDGQGQTRARFTLAGLYRGDDGSLGGTYTLDAGHALIAPYVGAQPLPAFALAGHGVLGVQTMSGAVDLTFDAATALSALDRVLGANPALPPTLTLHSAVTLALQGERLALTRLEHALVQGAETHTPLIAQTLQGPLVIELANPAALLQTPRVFGTLTVSGVPLPWINGLLAGAQIDGGTLGAAFELATDDEARVQLLPLQPVTLSEFAVKAAGEVLAPRLQLSLLPRITKSDARVRVRVDELALTNGKQALLGGSLRITQPLPATDDTPLRVSYALDADVDALTALPVLAARREQYPLPAALAVTAKGDLDLLGGQVTIAALDASVAQAARTALIRVLSRQAFVLPAAGSGKAFENPQGELATLSLRGFDLAWVSALVDGIDLRGTLANADLLLTAPAAGRLAFAASTPLRIDGLSARVGDDPMVSDLTVIAAPSADYSAQRVRFDLQQLSISSRGRSLVRGTLAGNVPLAPGAKDPLGGEGRLELDLQALAAQPALRRALDSALDRAVPDLALDGTVDFAASQTGDTLRVVRLDAKLAAGRRANFALKATRSLDIRPTLARGERLARHVVGGVELQIRDLSSAVIERFVALEGIDFAEINADLRLESDGSLLKADSAAPLRLERVRVSDGKQALLQPFDVGTVANFVVEGQEVRLQLADFALSFTGASTPALAGRVDATVEPERTVPLKHLSTAFSAQVPQWLSQPAVMPGHKLTAGTLTATIDVEPDGAIAARGALDGLAASAPLAISHIELPVTGAMAADGRGFNFTAPLTADGRSGVSNASVTATYAPEPGESSVLRLRLESALFYLNDLLATVDSLAPQAPVMAPTGEGAATAPAAPIALDRRRDQDAAWNVLPYGTELEYAIEKLFYTDYLAFDGVQGKLRVRKRTLSLTEVAARFHDSPMRLDGKLSFRREAAEPYLLDVNGTVRDFNLNQFFKELVPGERPRVKGLFSVKLKADGEMPNLGQLRNDTLFDIRMRSRKGVFRPLPPSSTLLASTSDVLGFVGESLSYVPTGGFGAGTIARLVNYISRVEYDVIDIHIRRPETQQVEIQRFLVQSPTISITAAGGIEHVPGKDILDSPLDLRANLDMSGRGAAILYSMGLLRNEQNDAGYWRGPEFKIWGTPTLSKSNFADIIRQASDGTVKGGVTRPLSGLIGNLKYRWFGKKPRAAVVESEDSGE